MAVELPKASVYSSMETIKGRDVVMTGGSSVGRQQPLQRWSQNPRGNVSHHQTLQLIDDKDLAMESLQARAKER